MRLLPDIIEEIVELIKPASTITNIVDNLNGYYTFTVAKLDTLLKNNLFITIENTDGFNVDSTEVFNINYTNKTFDIKQATGQAITNLGNFIAKAPYFDFTDTYLEYAENLSFEQQKSFRKDIEMFPAIYMPTKLNENDFSDNIRWNKQDE